jgi:ribonuclease D
MAKAKKSTVKKSIVKKAVVSKAQEGKKLSIDDILGTSAQRAENSRKVDSIINSRIAALKNYTPKNSNEYTSTPEFRKNFSDAAERANRAAKEAANSIPTKENGGLRKNGGAVKKNITKKPIVKKIVKSIKKKK